MIKLKRLSDQPILSPKKEHPWEAEAVFNCAAIYDNGLIFKIRNVKCGDPLNFKFTPRPKNNYLKRFTKRRIQRIKSPPLTNRNNQHRLGGMEKRGNNNYT